MKEEGVKRRGEKEGNIDESFVKSPKIYWWMKTSSLTHSKEKLTEWEMKLSRMRNSQQVKYNFNVLGFTVS